MAVTATPAFVQTPKTGAVTIVTNDTTILKTIITGGANGTILDSILVSSTDTSARDLQFYITTTADVAASGTLTSTGTNVSNNDTVTIGSKTYTFQTVLTNVDGNVKIGASATASMTNLFNAINGTGGTIGTDYATATVAHTQVIATNPSATTVFVRAISTGTGGNSIASTETAAQLSWGASTLTGGAVASSTDYLLCTISCAANSGNTNATSMGNILESLRWGNASGYPTFDANGNRILRLQAGEILKVKALSTLTAAKTITIIAKGGDL